MSSAVDAVKRGLRSDVLLAMGGLLMAAAPLVEGSIAPGDEKPTSLHVLLENAHWHGWPTWLEAWPVGWGALVAACALSRLAWPMSSNERKEAFGLAVCLGLAAVLGPSRLLLSWWWFWSRESMPLWDPLMHVGAASIVLGAIVATLAADLGPERKAGVVRFLGAVLVFAHLIPVREPSDAMLWLDGPACFPLYVGSVLVAAVSLWQAWRVGPGWEQPRLEANPLATPPSCR